MSIKKNIGVLVLLLVLLSMSAVSAEDVSINANDTYQTPNEIQKDFTSLQTDIDNSQGVFELTYDVKHGDDEIDNYGISITKTTIINGNGHTIDANGHGSIFVVKDSSVTLTLNDLTLINANPVSDSSGIVSNGGAVYFDGSTLIVNNVNFKNNTVYKSGGAIYTTGTCIVDSSVFDGNDVQFRSQNIDNGGAAIYADNGASLLISNSQIINNHKNMVIRDNNVGDLVDGVVVATGYTKISKSYFRNNSGCYGGAVTSLGYTNAGKNQIIIENSVFDANRAFQGAAVNVMGSTFKISGTNFTNNKGVGYGSGNPNVGALITWYGCEGTISDCNFINNTADNGAAYRLGDDNNGVSSASVDSCTFINNTASNQGGAVYEGGKTGKATLDIKNSIFTNNSAKKEGSAIYSGDNLNIDDDTTFTNNMVYMYYTGTLNIGEIKTFTDLQKAINMVEGYIYLSSNVTMLAGEADNFVNGIVVDHLVNLKCDGFTINANNLGRIFNVTSTADKLNIYDANLINGNADIGGAIYNTGSVYAYNTNFINNTAATMGGAVFNNGTLTIEKCIVDNNDITKRTSSDSEDYGGAAIYNWYDSTLFIKNSTISNNLKNYKNGDYVVGAVTSLGKTIISQNSYFVNNSGRWGGALAATGGVSGSAINTIDVDGTKFVNNTALYGGAMFVWASNYTISNSVFDNNSAFGKGDMSPNNNNGGALVVTQDNIPVSGKIVNSNFTNNKAQYGGAAWINEGTVDIDGSNFINNTATAEAGAIGFDSQYIKIIATVDGSKFVNNTAGSRAGAIYNLGDLTITCSEFDNNKAQFGDIIYNNNLGNKEGILSINGNKYSNFTENKAPIINIGDINTISSTGGIIVTVLDNKTVNVCYGDVVTLHATVVADGVLVAGQKLFFVIDNVEYIANSLGNGSYIASYEVKDVGSKTVGIVYDGSDVNIKTGMLNISKATPDLTVGALNITVGDLEIITVTGPKDATGLITLTLNGIDYILPIYNGEAKFYFQDLAYGTYDVSASYSGDNHYVAAENSTVFKVDKVLANLKINVEDITFGENGLVIITLPSDIDGSIVTVNVNGKVYPVDIENGFGKLPLRELDAGDYTISAVFAGNDKYLPGVSNALLTVSKADPALNVLISDVGYDGVFNINVALTGVDAIGLNGNVIVTVNNKDYSVNIVNGKGTAVGVKLAAGTYDFTAAWAGNDNYNAVGDSGKFSVAKVDSIIDVAVSDIKVGEDAVISVKLLSDATGSVTVTVNGKDYTETVVNGVANVKVADLKAGTYDVAVKYSGDNNYNAAVATSSFTVSKVDSTMDVTVNDIVFGGDLIVDAVLPVDATGEVVITVNGVDYHVSIENGKATGTISGLAAGDYTVAIKYVGDDKYIGVEVAENVNVAKAQPVLGVVIADVDYGNGFVIEATLTGVNSAPLSGNVIVTVAGKEYTVKVTDGKGIFTGDKLAAGTYGFAAAWAGNDNYNAVVENGDFKVNKIDSTVAVNADDIKVGENVTVTVNVPTDATGDVIIIVDGVDYTVAIENGKAVKTIADLKANVYTVTVKYSGDNNYNANQNTTEFTVSKISDYNMNITVPEFKEGVNSTINVVLPKDATGTVTVEIGGKNYTANVTDGVANVIIPGLGVGDYNITTTYSGDAKYDLMTKKGNITVIPNVDVNLDVDDVVMVYHDGTRLVAKLTDYQGKPIVNATIYFNINGVNYARTTDANGTASIALNLESGAYPVIVAYNGSASYSKISKNITVTINPSIIADDLVKMYKNDTKFSAKFLGSDGKVLANTTVKFNINGVLYTRTTNNDGVGSLAINLRPGEYVLTAYNPVTGEQQGFNITVKSLIVTQDLTKYYMNASSFQATIYDKNGSLAVGKNVTFNINGVFYTRTADENGVVSLAINLRPGEYIITTIYEGLDIGNNIVVLPTLVTSDLNMTYRDGSKFTAQTLDGQGKPLVNQNVTFNVNGRLYFKTTGDDGVASLTINLMSGKYIITSSWNDFQTGNNITIS